MTHHEVLDELPLAQGFALLAWSIEHNGMVPVERLGPGYIRQEMQRRLNHGRRP